MLDYFSHIIGHEALCTGLKQDIATTNISQAYLFVGPKHVGKRTIAKAFAMQLLCQGSHSTTVDACVSHIKHNRHNDFVTLDMLYIEEQNEDWEEIAKYSNAPQKHREKKNVKTDTISIDDIRALQDILYDTPEGNWRICFISNIERMNTMSANAFLKILEEPPAHLIFILTCSDVSQLLPTIVSRTRLIHVSKVPAAQMQIITTGLHEDDQNFILAVSQGAPGTARTLVQNPDKLKDAKLLHAQANSIWKATTFLERMKLLEPLLKRTPASEALLRFMAMTLSEIQGSTEQKKLWLALETTLATNANRALAVNIFNLQLSKT